MSRPIHNLTGEREDLLHERPVAGEKVPLRLLRLGPGRETEATSISRAPWTISVGWTMSSANGDVAVEVGGEHTFLYNRPPVAIASLIDRSGISRVAQPMDSSRCIHIDAAAVDAEQMLRLRRTGSLSKISSSPEFARRCRLPRHDARLGRQAGSRRGLGMISRVVMSSGSGRCSIGTDDAIVAGRQRPARRNRPIVGTSSSADLAASAFASEVTAVCDARRQVVLASSFRGEPAPSRRCQRCGGRPIAVSRTAVHRPGHRVAFFGAER